MINTTTHRAAPQLGKATDVESLNRLKQQAAQQQAQEAKEQSDTRAARRELADFDRISACFKRCQGRACDQAANDPKKVVLDDVPMLNIAASLALGAVRCLTFGLVDHPGLKARLSGVAEFDDAGNLSKLECEMQRPGRMSLGRALMMESPYSDASGEYHVSSLGDGRLSHRHSTRYREDLVYGRTEWNIEGSATRGYDFQYMGDEHMPRGWAWSGFDRNFQGHGHLDP
ncbi:MAG: hypothetical protein KC910_04305 [Candidatus Eremiobacteraeota bacterium]|nr:hypothetical protein [Candidatus Eremiobacteraeota bacterium]